MPVMRTVARIEQPSTKHFTTAIRSSFVNRFILTIMRERLGIVKIRFLSRPTRRM
jgi:hypothetical protein